MEKTIWSDKSVKLRAILKKAREDVKLTQIQLAERLNKPQSFVAKYEIGERRLDVVELTQIVKELRLELQEVIRALNG